MGAPPSRLGGEGDTGEAYPFEPGRPGREARALERERRRREEARALDAEILAAVARGWKDPLREEEFDALARRLFAHQACHGRVVRAWWRKAGARVRTIRGWRDVPPLPVAAYKRARVAAFPARGPGAPPGARRPRFLSSGTTTASRSRVFVETLDLYAAAIIPAFRRHCLPEGRRMRLLFLAPSPEQAPHSSLSCMFGVVRAEFGDSGSAFCADAGALRMEELRRALEEAAAEREAVFLLGPSFAFVHALDRLRMLDLRFALPAGSRIFQTGGFKGRSRAVEPGEIQAAYAEVLGVPRERIVNEYGMAELASQFYAGADGRFTGPPWVRWRVLDPLTLEPAPDGEPGVLAVWDLANRSNCFALRTEDLAVGRGASFELLGRIPEAEPRGCSLEADLRPARAGGAASRRSVQRSELHAGAR